MKKKYQNGDGKESVYGGGGADYKLHKIACLNISFIFFIHLFFVFFLWK